MPISSENTTISSPPLPCSNELEYKDHSPTAFRCRIQAAHSQASTLINAQSTTPEQAVIEYKRRYGRDPPAGFNGWVQFALDHDSKIIDDFDQINRDLEPYRSLEAKEVFRQLNEKEQDWQHTRRATFVDGVMNITKKYGYAYDGHWERLVAPFIGYLPNNSLFYLNTIDEPRILRKSGPASSEIEFKDRAGESIEKLVTGSCKQVPLELSSHFAREKDVCQSSEPGKLHGFIASPDTFSYTYSLVPVLSMGRMSAFRDIMIPCPCYFGHPLLEDDPVPFLDKRPALYWRGQSTGLRGLKSTWKYGHRHRLVSFIQSMQNTAKVLDVSRFFGAKVNEMVDEKMVRLFKGSFDMQMAEYIQCARDGDNSACEEVERALGPGSWSPEDTSLGFRYLFDVDGNSMSTRFYRLLSHHSVVLKQTWFQEWHDDRLVPWIHYVPVTLEMDELPSLMNFLVNDPEGKRLSEVIAQAGHQWSREVLREIDMSIYIYRLLLELAEIYGPVEPPHSDFGEGNKASI